MAEMAQQDDLFQVDKRLSLKPVTDFNAFLLQAFADGPCQCMRCVDAAGSESGYAFQHTFELGKVVNRQFARTTPSEVLLVLKKAWLSFFKTDLEVPGLLDLPAVQEFVKPELHIRLRPLLLACGLIEEREGGWMLQAVAE
ncbi:MULTISPECIES: hypothetical protein [Pseudomonas]|uniref:Uncharacterized protein n=3 Tax=Pseudomonas gingeri TaxID=117681 RepID=A0A7Y8CBU2_9PSED|nr:MULTISPECIES: hypothetical protein [Pseudomonas]NVZ28349.1 hypothetical protein [Pseudomonas gingeri]NVZ61960.1 hypothetical protein [Pseudomonas gingeri]NVZ73960.1 hypothetical protein [Pseudomonas gingeri]NWC12297.1 hypothetical protein [Pseudomonas gingeri]NWE47646.1 hypothetical protein [Pseudomonas gingeri]